MFSCIIFRLLDKLPSLHLHPLKETSITIKKLTNFSGNACVSEESCAKLLFWSKHFFCGHKFISLFRYLNSSHVGVKPHFWREKKSFTLNLRHLLRNCYHKYKVALFQITLLVEGFSSRLPPPEILRMPKYHVTYLAWNSHFRL